MKVRNIETSGKAVPNQFIIDAVEGVYFQSYDKVIVFEPRSGDKKHIDETYWKYSATTSRYRSLFLGETTKETEKKIKSGEYILTNLN